jgi:hypothetical protein
MASAVLTMDGANVDCPWVYGRFELYNNYRDCEVTRRWAWLSFESLDDLVRAYC